MCFELEVVRDCGETCLEILYLEKISFQSDDFIENVWESASDAFMLCREITVS